VRHPLAQIGQPPGDREHVVELGRVPLDPPLVVVAVLPAPGRVGAQRLDVAVGVAADPHVGPRGRDHQRADAVELGGIGERLAGQVVVAEALATPAPGEPGPGRVGPP
jgi:hypothetical protein